MVGIGYVRRGDYVDIIVESFAAHIPGHRDHIHIRPIKGQPYPTSMLVECSRKMTDTKVYPVGTRFRIAVIKKRKKNGPEFLYAYYGDPYDVVGG